MITLSIDVTLIDKSRLKHITRRNGKQAVFLELVMIETPEGEYGDFMVKQQISKEERESGVELPILGNGKNFNRERQPKAKPAPAKRSYPGREKDDQGEDIPF